MRVIRDMVRRGVRRDKEGENRKWKKRKDALRGVMLCANVDVEGVGGFGYIVVKCTGGHTTTWCPPSTRLYRTQCGVPNGQGKKQEFGPLVIAALIIYG